MIPENPELEEAMILKVFLFSGKMFRSEKL